MHLIKNKKITHIALASSLALSGVVSIGLAQLAHATPYQAMVRFDTMKASASTTGMVCAKPATTGTEGKVAVTFPGGFTVGASANWTVSTAQTSSWPTGAVAWPSIATGTSASQTVTFTSGDLTVDTFYCFNWTNSAAITNPSSAGSSEIGTVATQTSGGATIDSTQYATATLSNDSILVTATVPPIFTFSLGSNTDALGNLSTSSVTPSASPIVASVGTNAKNGWSVWAKSALANGGLHSASANYTIASNCNAGTQLGSNSTLSAGTEGYNTGVTATHASGSGTVSVSGIFNGSVANKGGGLCGTLQTLATSNGTATNDQVSLTQNVAINNATPAAADYTDTITVVGAGLF